MATDRLLTRLKAIDMTLDAQTPRAHASQYVREQVRNSDVTEVIRNLASVGIRLDRNLKNQCLRMLSARTLKRRCGGLPRAHQEARDET